MSSSTAFSSFQQPSNTNPPPPVINPDEYESTVISYRKYIYPVTESHAGPVIKARLDATLKSWLETVFGSGPIFIDSCCGARLQAKKVNCAMLYSLAQFIMVDVATEGFCSLCGATKAFDGNEYGVVNYNNKHLFTLELLLDMLNLKLYDGTPTHAYWKAKVKTLRINGDQKKTMLNMCGRLNGVLHGFLKLLEYPKHTQGCCENPHTICIDGILLSSDRQKIFNQNLSEPWILGVKPKSQRFSNRKERSLLPFPEMNRILIKKFVEEGITELDYSRLENGERLINSNCCITRFIKVGYILTKICSITKPTAYTLLYNCPGVLKPFFQCFYKVVAPASAIAPSIVWPELDNIIVSRKISNSALRVISDYAPVLARVVGFFSGRQGDDFELGFTVFKLILKKAQGCFLSPNGIHSSVKAVPQPFQFEARKEVYSTGVYFPGRPVIRNLYKIKLDNDSTTGCSKAYCSGTMLFWCAEHKRCLGFYILPKPESLYQVI
jgi:hypothetical protein